MEILVALSIAGMAIFPMLRFYSQTYILASKQVEQENALKIAEAAINKIMGIAYSELNNNPEIFPGINLPFNLQTQDGTCAFSISLSGSPMCGKGNVRIGKTDYEISLNTKRLFSGPGGAPSSMKLSYASFKPAATPPVEINFYSCPDDSLKVSIIVKYGEPPQNVSLCIFRPDLRN
ncbi:MAG: hypothetical protein HQM08_13165 [Candidatus Riflebacteria bacterium]|nr:hypothetical protein [Candidatus Riflebacteria bacterium]